MSRETPTDTPSQQLVVKLKELLEIVAELSPEEKQRLIDDPGSLEIGPQKTDLSKWKDEVQAYLDAQEPLIERPEETPVVSEEEGRRQAELQQAIFEKLGIANEIAELSNMSRESMQKKKDTREET